MGNRHSELERKNEELQIKLENIMCKYNKLKDLLHVDTIENFVVTHGGDNMDLVTICKYVGWIHDHYI